MESYRKLAGEILFDGVPKSKAIKRFVQRELYGWISGLLAATAITAFPSSVSAASRPGNASYRVHFKREGQGHLVRCEVEIRSGDGSWSSLTSQPGAYQALRSAVTSLKPRRTFT